MKMKEIKEIRILQQPHITEFTLDERILFPGLIVEAILEDGSADFPTDPHLEYEETEELGEHEVKVYYSSDYKEIGPYATFTYKIIPPYNNEVTKEVRACTSLLRKNSDCCTMSLGIVCSDSSTYSCSCSSTQTCCTDSSSCSSSSAYSCSCSSTQAPCCINSSSTCGSPCTSNSSCSSSSAYSCSCSSTQACCTNSGSTCGSPCTSNSSCSSSSAYSCSCSSTSCCTYSSSCSCTASGYSGCAACPTSSSYTTKNVNVIFKDGKTATDTEVYGVTSYNNRLATTSLTGTSYSVGNNYYYSNNKGVSSSTAQTIFKNSSTKTILGQKDYMSIRYLVNSESSYDKIYIYFMQGSSVINTVGPYSGYQSSWSTATFTLSSSSYVGKNLSDFSIKVTYVKDGSADNGSDVAWITQPCIVHYEEDGNKTVCYLSERENSSYYFVPVVYYVSSGATYIN